MQSKGLGPHTKRIFPYKLPSSVHPPTTAQEALLVVNLEVIL